MFGPKEKRPHWRFILSPDGRFLAIGNMYKGHQQKDDKAPPSFLHVWDLESGRRIHAWKTGDIFHAEFAPDSKTLIAHEWDDAGMKGSLRSWDLSSGNQVRRVELARRLSRFLCLPDGKYILGLSEKRDLLHRYEIATGKEVEAILVKGGPIFAFTLSPDGQNLAIAQSGRVVVQRLRDGMEIFEVPFPRRSYVDEYWHFSNAELVAFSPDRKTLAVATGRTLALWDLATGTRLHHDESMGGPVLAVHTHEHHLLTRDTDMNVPLRDSSARANCCVRFVEQSGAGPLRHGTGMWYFDHLHWAGNLQANLTERP